MKPTMKQMEKVVDSWEVEYYSLGETRAQRLANITRRLCLQALIKEGYNRMGKEAPFLGQRRVPPVGSGQVCNGAVGASSNIMRIV
jgi:hypothetical protein